ncbi:MAG: ribosome silencing factor [Fuerstiella sp.]
MSTEEFLSVPKTDVPADDSAASKSPASGQPSSEQTDGQVDPADLVGPGDLAEPTFDPTYDTVTVHADREEDLYQRSLENAIISAKCADEMRAKDIVVLDLTKIASIVDFFVIATGNSRRQMHAIADEVNRQLKGDRGNDRLGVEGYRSEGNWLLMDFGDVVLHVFTEEGRELYDLESLKADATRVDWRPLADAMPPLHTKANVDSVDGTVAGDELA